MKVEQCEGGAIERIGHNIRKIDAGGCARCNLCSGQILVYGSRGLVALKEHIKSASHRRNFDIRAKNNSLPGKQFKVAF